MKNTWNFNILSDSVVTNKNYFPCEIAALLQTQTVRSLLKSPFFQSLSLVDGDKHYNIYKNRFYALKEFTLRVS